MDPPWRPGISLCCAQVRNAFEEGILPHASSLSQYGVHRGQDLKLTQHVTTTTTMAYQTTAMQLQGDEELRKGTWLEEEDERLITFVKLMGERRWDALARASGLKRSGKSCRLRWLNYLRPNLKRGHISVEEERMILQLQELWGNKWSKIAQRLPGRTDNEIKNYWRTHLRKKAQFQEGYSQYQLENTKQDMFQNGDTDTDAHKKYNYENQGSVSDLRGLTDQDANSSDAFQLSAEFALTSSPYETRLSDWINSEISYQDECHSSFESSVSSLDWTPDDSLSWDCSGFLWDMN